MKGLDVPIVHNEYYVEINLHHNDRGETKNHDRGDQETQGPNWPVSSITGGNNVYLTITPNNTEGDRVI